MEDIKKLKEIELEIFRHFIEICNENSLRYLRSDIRVLFRGMMILMWRSRGVTMKNF